MFVIVLDSNDAPSDIAFNSSLSAPDSISFSAVLPENSPSGTSLTNLSVVDEDKSQQHNCELLEGGNYFYISSVSKSSWEIRVKQGVVLNYESHLSTPIQGKPMTGTSDSCVSLYLLQTRFSFKKEKNYNTMEKCCSVTITLMETENVSTSSTDLKIERVSTLLNSEANCKLLSNFSK